MDELTEIAKEITAILGAVSAVAAVLIAVSSKARGWVKNSFMRLQNETGEADDIRQLKETVAIHSDQIGDLIKASENTNQSVQTLTEIVTLAQTLIENHVTGEANEARKVSEVMDKVNRSIEMSEEFSKIQIGKEVRDIFNRYSSQKSLPPEKWQYIESLNDIYTNQLRGNSLAGKMLKEMENWDVDYETEDE